MSEKRSLDRSDQAFTFRGPWFRTDEGAAYIGCPTAKAFRAWLTRHGIAVARAGRRVLVAKADLDRAIGASHRQNA